MSYDKITKELQCGNDLDGIQVYNLVWHNLVLGGGEKIQEWSIIMSLPKMRLIMNFQSKRVMRDNAFQRDFFYSKLSITLV